MVCSWPNSDILKFTAQCLLDAWTQTLIWRPRFQTGSPGPLNDLLDHSVRTAGNSQLVWKQNP
jgi:hypothetical protein